MVGISGIYFYFGLVLEKNSDLVLNEFGSIPFKKRGSIPYIMVDNLWKQL